MIKNTRERMMLSNMILYDTDKDNQIQNDCKFHNIGKMINPIGPYYITALHMDSYFGHNEAVQLLLTNNAFKSLENISYRLTSYDGLRMEEIKELFRKNSDLFHSYKEIPGDDYIEWSLIDNNLIEKRKRFRDEIDIYKTYDNQHHLITKLLIEVIQYYLNEYLIQQEQFSRDEIQKLEFYFKQAIEEQNYLKYFIKAYTLTNNFYRVLNKHLALYILDYFDTSSYSSTPTKYRLINCLIHIVTLLIHHPDIHKYIYTGTTYRGLIMTTNHLKHYTIGAHILNRSFLSTSKDRSIAQMFAGNILEETSDPHGLASVPVLLKYIIKQNETAIDIEHMSMVQDEEEVLILPFSVFRITNRIENNAEMCSTILVEIDLEECEDNEQIDHENEESK
jgi:hypothetical protein